LEVHMEHLREPVLRLDEVLAEGLRAVVEEEVLPLHHPRHVAQALQLVLQAVLALDAAHEDAVLLAAVVRFLAHLPLPGSWFSARRARRSRRTASRISCPGRGSRPRPRTSSGSWRAGCPPWCWSARSRASRAPSGLRG